MRAPNQDDATLYLRLHALKDTPIQAQAREWFFESFDAASFGEVQRRYPPGSHERHLLAEFLGFFEAAGVLVSRGLLHEDVFFDAPFALDAVWRKLEPIISQWQRAAGEPAVWENVEWLCRRYEVWTTSTWRHKLKAVPPEQGPG